MYNCTFCCILETLPINYTSIRKCLEFGAGKGNEVLGGGGAGPRGGPCTIAKVLVMRTHLEVLQMGLAIAQILA